MKKPIKRNLIIIILITAVVISVAAFSMKTGNSAVSNVVGSIVSPVQKGAAVAVNYTGSFFKNVFNAGKNAKEVKKLQEEVLSLQSQLRMIEGYKEENVRIRELIDLNDNRKDFKSIGANIIGRDSTEFHNTLTIDKGSKDGIKKNAVVTVPEGLVGVVYEVGYNFSKVKTLYDSESSVAAVCPRSGDLGVVESSGLLSEEGKCKMSYIDKAAKIVVGDMIETSGTGGICPRGILIGKVTDIKEDSRKLTLNAVIEAGVNIDSIDKVLVSK